MKPELVSKYQHYPQVDLPDRQWPSRRIETAPSWCSVDLRDGNQALVQPMSLEKKLKMFTLLIETGFKEIEVGFPSASQVEYDFARKLITENLIPDDVEIQVLTQAREQLIKKTFASVQGAKKAIVHLYNSTSTLQRDVVFKMSRKEIIELGVRGARILKEEEKKYPETEFRFQYSPESFTGTELDFSLEICEAVMDVLEPSVDKPVIINLPATVEMSTPNIYADQIEWFCRNMKNRDHAIISLHTHNDRGCAVAATELALMAGGQRVEGTLFGNGERTGNVDIVTLALNMFTQGVDPELDFQDINRLVDICEWITRIPVSVRQPYAGELVYTAFSGSHQDAIKKGMDNLEKADLPHWAVPYLPIDPSDVGRTYESIIRINSQSGKGGMAYVMHADHGFDLPRWLQIDFSPTVQALAEETSGEVGSDAIYRLFEETYLPQNPRWQLDDYQLSRADGVDRLQLTLREGVATQQLSGSGNGVVAAFVDALERFIGRQIVLVEYSEHALSHSADAEAVCYIQLNIDGERSCGVGRSHDIVQASLRAILGALGRSPVHAGASAAA